MKSRTLIGLGLVSIVILFGVCACDEASNVSQNSIEKRIHYLKDTRTNLCFAFLSYFGNKASNSMTCVPCDSVQKFLEK
jgi:hypothetical protein